MQITVHYEVNGAVHDLALSRDDLLLLANALEIIHPDEYPKQARAAELALDFEILAELAEAK